MRGDRRHVGGGWNGAPQFLTYIGFDQFQRALYGVAMILTLMFLPDGLASLLRRKPGAGTGAPR